MKNRNNTIVNFGLIMLLICLFTAIGCKDDAWDDHYEQLDSRLENNILSILSEDSNYSTFVQYLNQTGYNEELASAQAYTVWAPNNAAFEQVPTAILNDPDLLKQLIGNHISLFSYNTAHNDEVLVKMFNDKYVEFINTNGDSSFGGVNLVEKDILASNGVLHTINEVIDVNPNIWGYLNDNVERYPKLMAYLSQFNETAFDEANSVKIGTNTLGQPVYDSIYTTTNTYFKTIGDLSSEEERFSFIGLTDDAYESIFDIFDDYYNHPLVDSVKNKTEKTIFRNLNFPQVDPDNLNGTTITSTTGSEVMLDPSLIVENIELSNGNVFVVNELDFDPRGVIYKPIRYEIENTEKRTTGSLTDFSIQKRYDITASEEFTNEITLLENPTPGDTNNFFEITFSNVLAASYKLNLKFTPVGATQDTKLKFQFSYIRSNFRPTIEEIGPIVVSNLEDGVVTIGDTFDFSFYATGQEDDYFFVKLKVIVDVSEPELLLYDRRFGIDYAELVPTE
ncbi:putative surface protein with fasciclin (FAS1) repeats [Jejuia pallidilutea]|uniref:Putative surface protein with fasciclin (FAS1) repeats n=1 Tax=Jejuia pallidilutea TaxID=504487 RepID=A0A362XA97_9FLAO|nr:fasciclin domain-containing protein [Jejuia pallidilutea]PQV48951.1 putative surface protein with fasciclin (FAS1) repeats [Jejuia pallidilutea]